MSYIDIKDMREQLLRDARKLREEVAKLREESNALARKFTWGPWEPCTLKIPRRINGRWYWPGAGVYRRSKMSFNFKPYDYQYGDEFDVLKND